MKDKGTVRDKRRNPTAGVEGGDNAALNRRDERHRRKKHRGGGGHIGNLVEFFELFPNKALVIIGGGNPRPRGGPYRKDRRRAQ